MQILVYVFDEHFVSFIYSCGEFNASRTPYFKDWLDVSGYTNILVILILYQKYLIVERRLELK